MSTSGDDLAALQSGDNSPNPRSSSTRFTTPLLSTRAKKLPKAPKMGELLETYEGSGEWINQLGGTPNPEWTKLDDPTTRANSALNLRPINPLNGVKAATERRKGLPDPFKTTSNLATFQKRVFSHLHAYGLETITYLPNPRDPLKMVTVVENHAKFTADIDKSLAKCAEIQAKFDSLDRTCDDDAKTFFLASVSEETQQRFMQYVEKSDSFAAMWLRFVKQVASMNSEVFAGMKSKIKAIRPQDYAKQDIEAMSRDYIKLAESLDNAGRLRS